MPNRREAGSVMPELPGPPKLAIIIQQGKVLDFIDGKTQRNETPEEYVRQEIAKSLVREYRYEKPHIEEIGRASCRERV